MKRLVVKTRFELTTTSSGKIYAEAGDILIVKDRDFEHYNIVKLNNTNIFSRWIRKNWVNSKCK